MLNLSERMFASTTKCLLLLVLFCFINFNAFEGLVEASTKNHKVHVLSSENQEPLVLDCDYDAEGHNSSLVVKWLRDEVPIYQWIKGHKPTVYPSSKGTIDEEFEISSNTNYKHRAVSFPAPTKELSGSYKCLVETVNSTELIQLNVQVIDVSQTNIEINQVTLPNDTLVTCIVENVYPEPKLELWSNDDVSISTISEKVGPLENGLYNATIVASASLLDAEDEIGCTVRFSGTEYNVTEILKSSSSRIRIIEIVVFVMFSLVILA